MSVAYKPPAPFREIEKDADTDYSWLRQAVIRPTVLEFKDTITAHFFAMGFPIPYGDGSHVISETASVVRRGRFVEISRGCRQSVDSIRKEVSLGDDVSVYQ